MVKPSSLTVAFSKARDDVDYDGKAKEQRRASKSHALLSERLFREQGISTQLLLGHSNQSMTNMYNDTCGPEWQKTGRIPTSFAEEI